MLLICPTCHAPIKILDSLEKKLKTIECLECDTKDEIARFTATPVYETDIYALYETRNGYYADADDNGWEWFDYPDIKFDRDMEPCFTLKAESIDCRIDLDMYRSFLDVIDAQISELADCIDKIQGADYV